ncbi:MAG: TOBE domain-containing protein, partial [Mobilitalea sp.]
PRTRFVADFIGESNIFDATIRERKGNVISLYLEVGKALGQVDTVKTFELAEMVYACVRPEKILYSKDEIHGFQIQGVVKEQIYVGNIIKSNIVIGNGQIVKLTRMDMDDIPKVGEMVYIYWNVEDVVIMKSRAHLIHNAIENVYLGGD